MQRPADDPIVEVTSELDAGTDQIAVGSGPTGGVVLRLGGSRFAAGMDQVAEVVALPSITRIPGAPAWLVGLANWRGRVLPVLDIRPLLGTPSSPLASSARLLVLQDTADASVTAGLVAEAVPGVQDVPIDALQPPPPTLTRDAANLVEGQVIDRLGPVAVLSVPAVLALRDRVDRRRHGS